MRSPSLTAVLATFFWLVAAPAAVGDDPAWVTRGRTGMVASDSPAASEIGAAVLRAGGNAFDAAVATSFALTVARPESTGIGGGGFCVAYIAAEKRFVALDFRETAPAAATADRYAALFAKQGDGPSPSVYGGNAVAVPGQLAGLAEINRRFGTRPLRELLQPAIGLADAGFAVDEHFRSACADALEDYARYPALKSHDVLFRTLLNNGSPPAVGETVRRPELAAALWLIAEQGPQTFYDGPIGTAIVAAVHEAGGALAADDLRGYRVCEREPLRGTYRGYEFVSMPPPSSGGVCLVQLFAGLERQSLGQASEGRNAGLRETLFLEGCKHAFADRARWLGDPDFMDTRWRELLAPVNPESWRDGPRAPEEYGHRRLGTSSTQRAPDDRGTSHFCVADSLGNVVALTETVNGTFGSLVVAEPYGILLNNEIDDFLTLPGRENLFGLQQGAANLVAPGKRPLSSMTPVIVCRDGRPVLALGASGGPRIITAVAQVMWRVLEFDEPLPEAVEATRLHHQWRPDEAYFDRAPPEALAERLRAWGYTIGSKRNSAAVQAIQLLRDGERVGVCDPRKGGRPVAP